MCRTFIFTLLAFNTFSHSSVILSVNNTAQKPQAEALLLSVRGSDRKLSIILPPSAFQIYPFTLLHILAFQLRRQFFIRWWYVRGGIEQPVFVYHIISVWCWPKLVFNKREYSQNTIYPIRGKRQEKTIKSTREKEDRHSVSQSTLSQKLSEIARNTPELCTTISSLVGKL